MNLFLIRIFAVVGFFFVMACSNIPCKIEDRPAPQTTGDQKSMTAPKDLTSRTRVYKADGSLQCGQGKKVDLSTMQKELGDIQIFSAENKNDGLMRIQVCGHPTGNCNVYEILEADLDKALKLGFKKWIRD
ncbi:MAG: hypothetical protein A2622_12195 [Bdellovibrionales bacterium RIFCSPHIGHO2_01_FULL_40_29]|nr:MAG: hypothetical protein A2622_12195 [Bdellovibrionales bacterium RIFCSPHIGHO2_01_FULL_40_29]OFZ32949.1 MAG: hypothetical protein A3D17_09500 [Bdellovibrionales bacterium RIFCSPHIGHO2_02_FULL_40_15]